MEFVGNNKVKINLGCITKDEVRALKRRLVSELEKVRSLVKELEKKETFFASGFRERHGHGHGHGPQLSGNEKSRVVGSLTRVNSEVGSVGPANSLPFNNRGGLSVATMDNGSEFVEKEKRTPKANQYHKNSDPRTGKGKSKKFAKFDKLSSAVENNRTMKSNGDTMGFASSSQLFKSCSTLLDKLKKHKFGWVFNDPVDPKKLGLHDYFTIVKHPMDLGTVKSRLSKNWYKSAKEFAEDVRLTFSNAMLYNPKGQDVHYMADQLSNIFEEKWKDIEDKFNLHRRVEVGYDVNLPTPPSKVAANPVLDPAPAPSASPCPASETRTLERAESMTMPVDSKLKGGGPGHIGRTPVPKKPKAKDLDKRDMTYDEKQRLSMSLQSLPSEKLDNIVQIIKKRNPGLCQEDDDIEVDLDSVDPETLWELDRFVTNYKKSLSKNKRKAEVFLQETVEAGHNMNENLVLAAPEAPRETEAAEKANASPSPVRGEQQGDNVSRSSSSGSSSSDSGSSSSDSDSDSSSGSGSDAGH